MAELNFGLLTPPGSQSIGNAFVTGMDQAAAARAQENQNALSQYTLSKARREDEVTNQLLGDLRGATTDEEIYRAYQRAGKGKEASELRNAALTRQKLTGEIAAQPGDRAYRAAQTQNLTDKMAESRAQLAYESLSRLSTNPNGASDEDIRAAISDAVQNQGLSMADATRTQTALLAAPMEKRAQILALMAGTASDRLKALTPDIRQVTTPTGGVDFRNFAPFSQGFGQTPSGFTNLAPGMTMAQTRTANVADRNADISQAGLGIRAVGVDPFNLTGIQDRFPVGMGSSGAASRQNNSGVVPAAPAPAAVTEPTLGGAKLSIKDAIAQRLTGDAMLAALPYNVASQVAAITDHRAAPPGRNTPRGDSLMQLVNMVDPTYDATQFKTKQGIETAFTSGRLGNTLRSLNVVQDHLDVFKDTAKDLGNDSLQFTNAMGNQIARWTGKPAPTDFGAVRNVVADELTKAILGTAGALGDRTEMRKEVGEANSPKQLAGVVNKWQKLIAGQVKGLQDQYESGGGSNKAVSSLFTRAAAATTTSKTAPAVGAIQEGYRFKGGDPAKVSNWEKVGG